MSKKISKKIMAGFVVMVMVVAGIFCTTGVSAMAFGLDLKGETEVKVGETIQLLAEQWMANDVYEPDVDGGGLGEKSRTKVNSDCIWTSSDESVAAVDSEGNVTGVSEGTVTIKAEYNNFGRMDFAELEITVKTADPTSEPVSDPISEPVSDPTSEPVSDPISEPSVEPSDEPTSEPAAEPSASVSPEDRPVKTGSDPFAAVMLITVMGSAALVIAAVCLTKKRT